MNTEVFNAKTQKENGTQYAGRVIRSGGLVAFPTETVYGLGANGMDGDAVQRIFDAKGRPSDNPLILHVAKKSDVKQLWRHVPDEAKKLMDAFWPGPLTLIFVKSDAVPDEVTAGLSTVAVRMPDHKTALALIRAAGVPIAAPSANISGRPSQRPSSSLPTAKKPWSQKTALIAMGIILGVILLLVIIMSSSRGGLY